MGAANGGAEEPLPPVEALREVAVAAAHAAGRRTLESFGRRLASETKADGSPVTDSDRESEAELRRVIRASFPNHSVLGEEGGPTAGDARVRWVLDPIDGTKSYVSGVPLYAVLVAVELFGRPVVGVIHLPALGETVAAATGLGCRWNGRPARVSEIDRLSEAVVVTTSVRAVEERGVPFRRLSAATRTQRGWGDGYGFALVATGRVDAMVDVGLQRWDVAPMRPILEEAGGRLTDWSGRETLDGTDFVASNGPLHEPLVRLLAER